MCLKMMFKINPRVNRRSCPFFNSHFRVILHFLQQRGFMGSQAVGPMFTWFRPKIDGFQAVHLIPRQLKIPGFDCHVPIKVVNLGPNFWTIPCLVKSKPMSPELGRK